MWVLFFYKQKTAYEMGISDWSSDVCSSDLDPTCGFIRTECMQYAEGASGTCYVHNEVWDCGYDADVGTVTQSTDLQCAGEIRCMGLECTDRTFEQSDDFARAAAAFDAAQHISTDISCTQNGTEANVVCEVFKGEHLECKKAV